MSEKKSAVPPWLGYKPGESAKDGEIIKTIYIKNIRLCVYKTVDGDINWENNIDLCPNEENAQYMFNTFNAREKDFKNKDKKKQFRALLLSEFISALSSNKPIDENAMFVETKDFLNIYHSDIGHFRYVITALIVTFVTIIPPLYYRKTFTDNDEVYLILVGIFFGSVGAFVSLLQRYNTVVIPKYSTWRFISIRAVTRIVIGSIFGGIFIILNLSGIILNIVNSNHFLLYSFAFISGFSERFFPELINKSIDQIK